MPRRKMTETEKFLMKLNKVKKQERHKTQSTLDDVKRLRIPEPAFLFKVGDSIVYGAWAYSEVLEVCEGGKYYKLFSCTMKTNYGNPLYDDKVHYEPWYELRLDDDSLLEKMRFTEEEDIRIDYFQTELPMLLNRMFDDYGIDLDPEYQRGNVWTLSQKQALIDSMFKNVDIGKFAIIKRRWGKNPNEPETPFLSEMLDGKQRLTAIYEFIIGKFKFKGLYFHELNPWDQNHIRRYKINLGETTPLTKEQKLRHFLKLNTSGTPVSEEHLDKVRKMWLEECAERDFDVYYPEMEGE